MKKIISEQAALLVLVSTIIILTNVLGYSMPIKESILGVGVLAMIALTGLTINKMMSRFIKLPAMMYVSLLGLILASPISPVSELVIGTTSNVAFLAPTTALGTFAGISLGKDIKDFAKMSWKLVILTVFVITGTFLGSVTIAHIVLKVTGAI